MSNFADPPDRLPDRIPPEWIHALPPERAWWLKWCLLWSWVALESMLDLPPFEWMPGSKP